MSLRTGDEIFRHSLQVVRGHPQLLVFPLLIIALGLTLIAWFLPLVFHVSTASVWHGLWNPHENTEAVRILRDAVKAPLQLPLLWIAGAWLTIMFATNIINVAFYSQVLSALNGGEVSIGRGFTIALNKLQATAGWALLASTIGVIMDFLERILGPLVVFLVDAMGASLVMRRLAIFPALMGVPWTAAAQFVIPVMLNEPVIRNPIEYLKISARMVDRVWGHAFVVGMFGASAVGIYAAFGALGFFKLAAWLTHMDALVVWGVIVGFTIYRLADGLNDIYRCGLYVYATEGVAPGPFDAATFNRAWEVR